MNDFIGTKENNWTVTLSDGEHFRLPPHFFKRNYSFNNEGRLIYEDTCQQCTKTFEQGNHQ